MSKQSDDNRYDILQEVGRGAMGIVYKAMDRETSECVALKVLKPEVVEDRSVLQRFKNELRTARKITHKNVCRIYEFTHVSRGPCISMEFVDGETLRSLLNRIGAFSLPSSLDITRQICSGLREAHAQGVVHRDLKPENLMVDRNGNVKIMDFGVARVFSNSAPTTMGMFVGTPAYMPPEQVEGREADQRSDIYALGLILYELLTGSVVVKADTPLAVAYKQVHDPVPLPRSVDPGIPENVQTVILRCLEKDPEHRFQTIEQLLAAFKDMGNGQATTLDPPVPIPVRHNTTFIMARRKARVLMMAVQVLYFSIYSAALYHAEAAGTELEKGFQIPGTTGVFIITVLAMLGIATRVYLSSALVWDHPELPRKFRRLFPALWLLDSIWAASPVLLLDWMRPGIILGCVAVLAYVPFSQKTLMENMSLENPLRRF
jgi:tRNA A-37 threonylcarbamoyl transferase component Bud32